MPKHKIIVAGTRLFNDYEIVKGLLSRVMRGRSKTSIQIVSGGAPGADSLGERFANEFGLSLKIFRADWDRYGTSAGPIRNGEMAKYATHCLVFWDGKSRGSGNMIKQARENGLKTVVYDYYRKKLESF